MPHIGVIPVHAAVWFGAMHCTHVLSLAHTGVVDAQPVVLELVHCTHVLLLAHAGVVDAQPVVSELVHCTHIIEPVTSQTLVGAMQEAFDLHRVSASGYS